MAASINKYVKKYMTVVILAIIILFFSVADSKFFTIDNGISILRQVSMLGITAVGMSCCMLVGDINLACGVLQGFSSVVCCLFLANLGVPVILAYVLTLAIGTMAGGVGGAIIVKTGMPALIGTLGIRLIINGGAYLISGGLPIYGLQDNAKWIGQGFILGIPVPVIFLVVFFIIGSVLLNRTYIGRHLFAIGSNAEATRLSGINVDRIRIFAFAFSSFCSSVAGLILMARNASGQPNGGNGGEMNVITACVVGGVSALGGECNPANLIVGVLIIGVLTNGMTILGVNEYWQTVIRGAVLILAVGFDFYQKTRRVGAKVPVRKEETKKD